MFPLKPLCDEPRQVILDTDIGPDCDDAGALAILSLFSRKLGFKIAALINCTSNPWGNGTAEAIMRVCGVTGVPQGRFMRHSFLEDSQVYNRQVATDYSPDCISGRLKVEDSLELYRRTLLAAPDKGVTVITIGQMNAIGELFEKEPGLCGRKIASVVSMAGSMNEAVQEYNVKCHVDGAKAFFDGAEKLGIPVVLLPFETGADVMTGFAPDDGGRDPIRDAYRIYTGGAMRRNSWDLTAVHFAVLGENGFYRTYAPGKLTVLSGGEVRLVPCEGGNVSFADKTVPHDVLERELDGLIAESCL